MIAFCYRNKPAFLTAWGYEDPWPGPEGVEEIWIDGSCLDAFPEIKEITEPSGHASLRRLHGDRITAFFDAVERKRERYNLMLEE